MAQGTFAQQRGALAQQQTKRLTRTQRVALSQQKIRDEREKREFEDAKKLMESANYGNYEETYNKIPPKFRGNFISPTELKQTSGYKQYQKDQADVSYVQQLINIASKMDRGKPFPMGLNPPKSLVRDVNAYREGVGTGSREEMRTAWLQQRFPNLDKGSLSSAVSQGTVNEFSYSSGQYGMDLGQKVTITTKDTTTGELKDVTTYEKIATGENKGLISTTKTTYKSSEQIYQEEKAKQDKLIADAQAKLNEVEFGKDVNLNPPKQSIWSKTWTGIKSLYFASPFGTAFSGISESKQKDLTAERENRVFEAFVPQQNKITGTFEIPLYKFSTLPLTKSWQTLQEQRELDYEQKEASKLLNELEVLSSGGGQVVSNKQVEEMKPYIMTEGLKVIGGLGVEMKEVKGYDFENIGKDGTIPETTTIMITDPSFDRRISQNMLEWENTLKKEGTTDAGFWEQLKPTSAEKLFLETRIVSSKALETYGLMKGIQLGFTGIATGYKALGLPTLKFYKTIQLAEGTAQVPRTFGATKTAIGLGITGVYGYGKYLQYEAYTKTSEGGSSLFALETTGELIGIESATHIGQRTFNKAYNRIKNWNLETINQPDLSQKGFMRENKLLGGKEHVYMERYQGFKLSKPKSWLQTLQGYEKGQFIGRQYKLIPDEVLAYYKYGGDVQVYDKSGQLIKIFKGNIVGIRGDYGVMEYGRSVTQGTPRTITAEAFPYDSSKTHLKWFLKENIAEYGLPQKYKLPIDLKDYKAFGYSATGEAWTGTQFDPNKIMYVDQGVIKTLETQGAIQYVSGKGVSAGFLRIFPRGAYESGTGKYATDPVIYADYMKDIKVNKAIKEIKGWDTSGRDLKAYIYKNKVLANELNIGGMKREVEGTVEISNRIPIRQQYAIKLEGWKVPVVEQIFGTTADLSTTELKSIIKSMGSITEVSGMATSSLPAISSSFPAMYSIVSYPKPSRSAMSSISKTSRISDIMSEVSRVSRVSRASSISRMSEFPRSEVVSDILRSSRVSYVSSVPKSVTSRKPLLFLELKGKIKQKRQKKLYPELFGLMPDFTARAIGLSPKEVGSVEGAVKEIKKLQTGFGIRSGIKIKGLNEKNLMRNIMK